jgi:hypothetical protein
MSACHSEGKSPVERAIVTVEPENATIGGEEIEAHGRWAILDSDKAVIEITGWTWDEANLAGTR